MKAYVTITDEQGQIVAEAEFDACQPYGFRNPAGKRIVGEMPQTSDQTPTGTYEYFGFTYQPHVRVDRPNGYVAPPPVLRPVNGPFSPPFASVPVAPRPQIYPGVSVSPQDSVKSATGLPDLSSLYYKHLPNSQQGPGLASNQPNFTRG